MNRNNFNRIVWATPLKQLLDLTNIEKSLSPLTSIVYKRPPSLTTILCNYKTLSHAQENTTVGCYPCGHCTLCGCRSIRGNRPVCAVATSQQIISFNTKTKFIIKQRITCQDFGIYVVTCRLCNHQYVGQTITTFSTRWAQHRTNWNNKNNNNNNDDRASLRLHYKSKHKDMLNSDINSNFSIQFIEIPDNPAHLDFLESRWIARLDAKININSTVLNFT